ncbi:MAG: NAD(P)-dependent dehydrogenase (short-subunit alcohol dehydrogenase family) [Gammaproteobacteria bacterium]|jgi:NAD(P)-dependent dehydrogenase (short-subunit alcohol dehydrogenase family)
MSKVLLVTGSSRGIGAETVRQAAINGYAICVNYHKNKSAAETLVESLGQTSQPVIIEQADISQESDVIRLFTTIDRHLGPLTSLVNNAGILENQRSVVDMTVDRLTRVFATNITGSFLCCREAVKRMSTSFGGQGGSIVNLSSRAAVLGAANEYVDYAASKGAIDSLTIGLANEVSTQGIRVNAVRPGLIYTDIHANSGEPGRVDRLKAGVPMQRGGTVREVAESILWLLSDASSYTTGSFIDVSGGR